MMYVYYLDSSFSSQDQPSLTKFCDIGHIAAISDTLIMWAT